MIMFAFYGLLGGVARALVGITKAMKKKGFWFDYHRFGFTLVTGAVVGVMAGLLMAPDYKLALLAGYAGSDLLDLISDRGLFNGIRDTGDNIDYYWIYFALFSTVIPTLIHLALAGGAATLWKKGRVGMHHRRPPGPAGLSV